MMSADHWKQLKKEHPEIEFKKMTRKPDTIVKYKGIIIGKFSHTKKSKKAGGERVIRQAKEKIKEIDKGNKKELRYKG